MNASPTTPVPRQGSSAPAAPGPDTEAPPQIGGILGRAMESARRSEEPFLGVGQREEFPGPLRSLFRYNLLLFGSVALVFGLCYLTGSLVRGPYETIFGFSLLAFVVGSGVLALRRLPASWTGVVVGTDGIIVRRRFLRYSEIERVQYDRRVLHAREHGSGVDHAPIVVARVIVRLRGGGTVDASVGDADVMLTRAIQDAHAAWAGGQPGSAIDEAMMARAHRSGPEWLEALRRLGGGAASAYRGRVVDLGHLSHVLGDGQSRPATRAAAAVVLAAVGDKTATTKLRIAADSVADPRVRVQLKRVAEARDDAALAEALETFEESDREERA